MKSYRHKSPIFQAKQFDVREHQSIWPLGVESYSKSVPTFDEFDEPYQTAYRIEGTWGNYTEVRHTDWIVYGKGSVQVYSDRDFKRLFEEE